ncbi:hypothetical protein COL5a_002051 [Colletotrichum fioriniae]|nr:hypothetical protein COL5a_002051 [Colletotrichum fioriniae]
MANVEANQKSAIEGADVADVAPEPVTPTTSIEEAKRSSVVEPPGLLWPGVLGNTALNAALHTGKREDETE